MNTDGGTMKDRRSDPALALAAALATQAGELNRAIGYLQGRAVVKARVGLFSGGVASQEATFAWEGDRLILDQPVTFDVPAGAGGIVGYAIHGEEK